MTVARVQNGRLRRCEHLRTAERASAVRAIPCSYWGRLGIRAWSWFSIAASRILELDHEAATLRGEVARRHEVLGRSLHAR